jgi:hypothetical protein
MRDRNIRILIYYVVIVQNIGFMAKSKPTPKNEDHQPGSRSRAQNVRTAYLNQLASDLNNIIGKYADKLKNGAFYPAMQSRFRREKLDNRFLLLKNLEGMEVNSSYPLEKLGKARISVKTSGGKMIVSQDVIYHPSAHVRGHKANCYYYQVLLLVWTKDQSSALPLLSKKSAWISLDDELPFFEYPFDRPENAEEWLVCVHQVLGIDDKRIEALVAEGMQLVLVGTFKKKDLALYEQQKKEAAALRERSMKKEKKEDEERVQPIKRKGGKG